jgi:hypothetical protein
MMGTRNYSSRANVHGCVHACRPMFIELASNISQPTSTESILVFGEFCPIGWLRVRLDVTSFSMRKKKVWNFFFLIKVGVRASLRASRIIPRVLKLMTM